MPGSNPSILNLGTTTPWSRGLMLKSNAGGGLDSLGVSTWLQPRFGDIDLKTFKANMHQDAYNVRDWGATADGVTDDRAAIQACIDAAYAADAGPVRMPAGTYALSSALVPKPGSILGVPMETVLLVTTAGQAAFDLTGIGGNMERWHLSGLHFKASAAGCYGIKGDLSRYIAYSTFERLEFDRAMGTCVQGVFALSAFRDSRFGYLGTAGTTHVHINGVANPATKVHFTTMFEGCGFYGAKGAGAGVDLDYGNTVAFRSCVFEFGSSIAVRLKGCRSISFDGCNWEGCAIGTYALHILQNGVSDPSNAQLRGGRINNNGLWTHFAQVDSACSIGITDALITAGACPIVVGSGINENRSRISEWRNNTIAGYGAGGELDGMPEFPSANAHITNIPTALTADTSLADICNTSGRWFSNEGATADITLTLPSTQYYKGILRFTNLEDYVLRVKPFGVSEGFRFQLNRSIYLEPRATIEIVCTELLTWDILTSTGTIRRQASGEDGGYINNPARAISHDYAAGSTDWALSADESAASQLVVTNASGAANAVFPVAIPGKDFKVYNNSGQTITFKVTGQTGSAVANGKRAIFVMDATDCNEIYEQP